MDVKLSVDGMHCGACVRRVSKALEGVRGVAPARVDIGSAEVSYDPNSTKLEALLAALKKAGYTARETPNS